MFARTEPLHRNELQRPLGNGLLLDRLLAGGIIGEFLPLANLCCQQNQQVLAPRGAILDVQA